MSYSDSDDGCSSDSGEYEVDAAAIALSPNLSPPMAISIPHNTFPSGTTVIQQAKHCTVYEKSHVVHVHNSPHATPAGHDSFLDQGFDFIETQAKRLNPVFVAFRGVDECNDVLESETSLLVIGNPGDGKTSASIMTIHKLMKEGFQPIIVTTPNDWNSKVVQAYRDEKVVVFIDDMFGTVGVDGQKVNDWLALNDVINQLLINRNGDLKIVCTVRKRIYLSIENRIKRFRWFRSFRVVDLSSNEYALEEEQKTQILQNYFQYYHISKEQQCMGAAKLDPPHGFPHCVELYCTEQNCCKMGIAFFKSPMAVVEREMKILYETRSTDYYALLLVLLSPKQILAAETVSGMEEFDKELLNRTRVLSKIPTRDQSDIVFAIENMRGVYLEEYDDGSMGFKHNYFGEVIAQIASRICPIPAVNYLSMQVLSEKTVCSSYKGKHRDTFTVLPKKCTVHLAVRITNALFHGEAFAACKHQAWDDERFLNVWLDYVTSNMSDKNNGRILLHDLIAGPLERYVVLQVNTKSSHSVDVGLMFLLYLYKKEFAMDKITKRYSTYESVEECETLSKFRREHRCNQRDNSDISD